MTDNASNCKAAFEGKAGITWIGCCAHTLHLIVKAGLKVHEVSDLMARLKDITSYIHSSTHAHLFLKENEEWLGFPDLTVLSECPTRWGSLLKSVKRMLEVKQYIVLYYMNSTELIYNLLKVTGLYCRI